MTALMTASATALSLALTLFPSHGASPQRIAHIDSYGLRKVDPALVTQALQVEVGDSMEVDREAMVKRLKAIEGVSEAQVMKMMIPGKGILLIGIQEVGAPVLQLRESPKGDVRLPDGMLETYTAIMDLDYEGMMKGKGRERVVDGHSFTTYEPAHEQELILQKMAIEHEARVRDVLRNSSDGAHRGAAAKALTYVVDKRSIIEDLAYCMTDPDGVVRNNGVRALSVLAQWASGQEDFEVKVDVAPLIVLLESYTWTDRNKSAALLYRLTESRDPKLLARLRDSSIPALAEMALWHSVGHATTSVTILGRMAGFSEEEIVELDRTARSEGDEMHQAWIEELREGALAAAEED